MVVPYNETGVIGQVMAGMTTNITGSLFVTLLVLVTLTMVVLLLFRVPLEWQAVIVTPFLIALMAYTGEFIAIGGVILIIDGAIFTYAFIRGVG